MSKRFILERKGKPAAVCPVFKAAGRRIQDTDVAPKATSVNLYLGALLRRDRMSFKYKRPNIVLWFHKQDSGGAHVE